MSKTTSTAPEVITSDSSSVGTRQRSGGEKAAKLPAYTKHRRRNAGEVVTRAAAIINFCRECMGWDPGGSGSVAEAVRQCPSAECWLYPYRNGPLDSNAQRNIPVAAGDNEDKMLRPNANFDTKIEHITETISEVNFKDFKTITLRFDQLLKDFPKLEEVSEKIVLDRELVNFSKDSREM